MARDKRGIHPGSLGVMPTSGGYQAAPSFMVRLSVASTDTTVKAFDGKVPFSMRVVRAFGIMTAAGSSSDTVVIQRVRSGTTNSITNTADLSVMSDTDQFDFGQINDAYYDLIKGDILQVTAAGGAACEIFVECLRTA